MNVGGQWIVVAVTFPVANGCSLQKWDPVKRGNTSGASGHAGEESGGASRGGKGSVDGSSTRGGKGGTGPATSSGTVFGGGGGDRSSGGASQGGGATGNGGSPQSSPPDPSRPRVVSISPVNDGAGIRADANVTLTFSEPMDPNTVAAALSMPPLARSALSLSWSSNNTQLTVTPIAGLSYANGASVAETKPLAYTVQIGSSAADAEGQTLTGAYQSSFTTLRRITQVLKSELVAVWNTYNRARGSSPKICAPADEFKLGHWSVDMVGSGDDYGFVFHDLAKLATPGEGALIETAEFRAEQQDTTLSFYPKGRVILLVQDFVPFGKTILDQPPTAELGVLATGATATLCALDISSTIRDEFSGNRLNVLFRLAAADADPNEYAYFHPGNFAMRVVFVVP